MEALRRIIGQLKDMLLQIVKRVIILSQRKTEHHAVLHTVEYLEKHHDFTATYLNVDEDGLISLKDLEEAITDETILISVMFANMR